MSVPGSVEGRAGGRRQCTIWVMIIFVLYTRSALTNMLSLFFCGRGRRALNPVPHENNNNKIKYTHRAADKQRFSSQRRHVTPLFVSTGKKIIRRN